MVLFLLSENVGTFEVVEVHGALPGMLNNDMGE